MHLVIISGRSGSGKSTALHVLEDIGYNCIDNLPASLLPALVEQAQQQAGQQRFAVGIDARNANQNLDQLPQQLAAIQGKQVKCDLLFLEARSPVLIQRFSETRRKHPLSDSNTDLLAAIKLEKKLLQPVADIADQIIDTSALSLHQLRDLIKRRINRQGDTGMAILFQSFGFKYGTPLDADLMFDARCLPNPYWKHALRSKTGLDPEVIKFMQQHQLVADMFSDIRDYLTRWLPHFQDNNRSYITIAIGCTGGQHRSVYLSEQLRDTFAQEFDNVQVRHRELHVT